MAESQCALCPKLTADVYRVRRCDMPEALRPRCVTSGTEAVVLCRDCYEQAQRNRGVTALHNSLPEAVGRTTLRDAQRHMLVHDDDYGINW